MRTITENLEAVAEEIKGFDPELKELIDEINGRAQDRPANRTEKIQQLHLHIMSFSLLRIRHFIHHTFLNNVSIETMQTLAIGRYIFELVVWLKLIQKDNRFAVLFNKKCINDHVQSVEQHLILLRNERTFYFQQGQLEDELHREVISGVKERKQTSPEETGSFIAHQMEAISQKIDDAMDYKLLFYFEEVKTCGYRFVGERIQKEFIPSMEIKLDRRKKDLEHFRRDWDDILDKLGSDLGIKNLNKMSWKDRARFVEMDDEYDFLYSYASRLLHASPGSVLSKEQNLRYDEFFLFWRYTRNQIRWTINSCKNALT